jgi:RimJ/RimL family protein N-acetyltransferase
MLDEIIIRHAASSDVASFRELRLEALRNHPTAFMADYEETAARPNEHWQERLKIEKVHEALFFAERAGQLVGMTGIFRGSSKKNLHKATIAGVYVKPEWRGQHVAELMIGRCLDWARQRDIVIVYLGVMTANQPAISCYERCGFSVYGTEPKAICYNGIYYDEYLMAAETGN